MVEMDRLEIDELLEGCLVGRLCMSDRAGHPYAVPMPFCWHGGSLYLRLPLAGRKGAILSENDRVCFEVDRFSDTLDEYASVLIEGRLIEVKDLAEKSRVKSTNDAKYTRLRRGHRPGHGRTTPLCNLPMRKIVVESLSGRKKEAAPVGTFQLVR